MRTEYIWEIKVKNTPVLKRKCNHCNSNRFYCSNKFRVNAQKRNIDVWLIYRCVECDSTYNLTILSRTKPELIKSDLFLKFSENDEETAWKYAFSAEIAQRNSVEPDDSSVEYEILHNNSSINDILNANDEIVAFKIQTQFHFGLKLSSVIRSCLELSANQFNHMVELEGIFSPENYSLKKHKIRNGDIILINREKFQSIYKQINTGNL
ncbi:DUF1062 domain-containing protein [Bacteroides thetaiotaomicron]|jgi:hypothetical protein|uniref:DUF1062 domain-containing protein n=1 Tax=Bacteroides thetaiotaomicron TaxID=818 RepID=UPI0039C06462